MPFRFSVLRSLDLRLTKVGASDVVAASKPQFKKCQKLLLVLFILGCLLNQNYFLSSLQRDSFRVNSPILRMVFDSLRSSNNLVSLK